MHTFTDAGGLRRLGDLRILNSGRHGTVYKALDLGRKSHPPCAVKVLLKERQDMDRAANMTMIKNEIDALQRLRNCSGVVRIECILEDDEAVYIVQDLCQAALPKRDACLVPDHAVKLLVDVSAAIAQCHSLGIVHGDVKPDNIMFDEEGGAAAYKLVDFGSSARVPVGEPIDSYLVRLAWGTPRYLAPEVVANKGLASTKSDVWAFGVMSKDIIEKQTLVRCPVVARVIERCLSSDPLERCSAQEAAELLDSTSSLH